MKAYAAMFVTVFLAELGDKTQLATFFFATNPAVSKVGVFLAAASALIVSSALATAVGAQIGTWVPPEPLRIIAALGLIGIGIWMLLVRS